MDSSCTFEFSKHYSPAFNSKNSKHVNQYFFTHHFFLPAKLQNLFRPFQGFQRPRTWAECTSTRCEAQQKTITINNVSHRVFLALLEHLGPPKDQKAPLEDLLFWRLFGVRCSVRRRSPQSHIYICFFLIDTYILGSIKLTA